MFIFLQVVDGKYAFSKCSMFTSTLNNATQEEFEGNVTSCIYGWEFDTSEVPSSIVIDV